MMTSYVLIDLTTSDTPGALRPTRDALRTLAATWKDQLSNDIGPEWFDGGKAATVHFRVGASPTDRRAGERAIHFRGTIPEAPNAAAYHQDVEGVPDIEIGCELFSGILDGDDPVSSGGSHEIAETDRDPGCNLYADRQDGSGLMDALELSDFVQNTTYKDKRGITVSNFLRASFFIPGSRGPWDFLGVMKSHYDVSNGYGICIPSPKSETQIGGNIRKLPSGVYLVGDIAPHVAKRKSHRYSRTFRRAGRLFMPGAS